MPSKKAHIVAIRKINIDRYFDGYREERQTVKLVEPIQLHMLSVF